MGTGVGEAMLIGAAVGAGTGAAGSAISGGDPLKGAMMGAATGAITGGVGNYFSPAAQGVVGADAVASQLGVQGAQTGVGSQAAMLAQQNAGFGLEGLQSISGAAGQAIPSTAVAPGSAGITAGMPITQAPITQSMATPDPASLGYKPNIFGYKPGEEGFLTNTQLGMIGGTSALGAAMQAERNQYGVPGVEDYESSFDPSKFTASRPTYAPEGVYRPQYRDYTTAAEGGIMRLANGGPVERMTAMNTAINPQGGLYPQGMIDKTQYATPTQRPASLEMLDTEPAYERSNPMLMASGGEVKGYAAGGMPDFGNGYNPFANLPPMSGPLGAVGGQRPIGMQPMGVSDGINPFSPERMAVLRNDPKFLEMQRVQGGGYDAQGRPVDGLGNLINQPTGQSTFPGAASVQGGFGQGAPGYPSLTMGSNGSGGFSGGTSGAFPLEGRYGIVKMNVGGVASILEAARAQGLSPEAYQNIYGRGNAIIEMQKALKEGKAVNPGMASGGISSLGGYSDGGRMLRGPGDGMSDSIPGVIGGKQPARLADGEFVVPADVVSHLGNGSTDAGAKRLYSMMDKVRKARTGTKKQGKQINPNRFMPA